MNVRQVRSFSWALLVSLLVHVLILGDSAGRQDAGRGGAEAGFLQVVLKDRAVVAPPVQASEVPKAIPVTPAASSTSVVVAANERPVVLISTEVRHDDFSPTALGASVAHSGSGASLAATVGHPSGAPDSGLATDRSVSRSDSDELRYFRLRIAALAARYKDYPSLARERGWEGVVDIMVSLRPSMSSPEVTLERSSGIPLLDQAALGMVTQAAGALEIPARLQGKAIRVILPVDYRLDD